LAKTNKEYCEPSKNNLHQKANAKPNEHEWSESEDRKGTCGHDERPSQFLNPWAKPHDESGHNTQKGPAHQPRQCLRTGDGGMSKCVTGSNQRDKLRPNL
jgi:hypothetical protein